MKIEYVNGLLFFNVALSDFYSTKYCQIGDWLDVYASLSFTAVRRGIGHMIIALPEQWLDFWTAIEYFIDIRCSLEMWEEVKTVSMIH